MSDATDVSNTLIGMHYKNMESCNFERIEDDKENWCLANADKCIGLSSMVDNIWNEGPSLFSKVTDLYDIVATEDACFSDSELVSEVERITEDITSIISTIWGFDLKWDQTRQVSHIKRRDFRK